MTQALNFTPRAVADLCSHAFPGMPGCAAATGYLAGKLRQAQVFVLSDHGELLDRTKPRPEVPGIMFKPPFDVVALEYPAVAVRRADPFYTSARSTRRIALAWDWADDLPAGFGRLRELGPGVMVASISFMDDAGLWMPMSGALHLAYDSAWQSPVNSPFRDTMIELGHYAAKPETERSLPITPVPLMFEACLQAESQLGSMAAVLDSLHADVTDELNAYIDLCYALACKNVSTRQHAPPEKLNRHRVKSGKLPLMGFHVLELSGGGEMPGPGGAPDRTGPRSHLRRGHIRRLSEGRVTWVNSTVVRGHGFIDKQYSVKGRANG